MVKLARFMTCLLLVWTATCQFEARPTFGQQEADTTRPSETSQVSADRSGLFNKAPDDPAFKNYLRDIWTDQKVIWSSPVRMNRHQWLTIALPFAAGTAGLFASDKEAVTALPNTPDQIRWSERVSHLGGLYTLGGVIGAELLIGKTTDHPHLSQLGRLTSEAVIDSMVVSYGVKTLTTRERPLENQGQGRFWKGSDSFPSGHATHSWAAAMVIVRDPHTPKWLKVTACSVATAVSLSRWSGQKHFPSDIFVGSVLGGLIGNYVATRPGGF
jgi:hypothetical protein